MAEVYTSDHELRRCDACGYQNVRPRNAERVYPEIPCHGCRAVAFTIFDPLWIERDAGFTINPEKVVA